MLIVAFAEVRADQETAFLKAGDAWVCVGDSITHQNAYQTYIQNTLDVLYPEADIRLTDQGVNGAKAADRVGAVKTYVAANRTTLATVMFGVNDTGWSAADVDGKKLRFAVGISQYVDLCADRALPVVFLRETHWSHTRQVGAWEGGLNRALDALQAGEADLLRARGVPFVDVRGAYERALDVAWAVDPAYELTPDIIHPNAIGHIPVAIEILRAFGAGLPLSTGDTRGKVRVAHDGQVDLAVAPTHGLLSPGGELAVAVCITNRSDKPVSGLLQAVVGTKLYSARTTVPARTAKVVRFTVAESALPGRWQMSPLYVAFSSGEAFAATGAPFWHARSSVSEKAPLALGADDATRLTHPLGTVSNLVVRRSATVIRAEFDWADATPVAAKAGFKNRFGAVIPFPLDLRIRGCQASDAVELLFDVRPPESIGRYTSDTDSNPAGVVRVGLYRELDGDMWRIRMISLPEQASEALNLTAKGTRMAVEFAPGTTTPVGFSMRVTDRMRWSQDEGQPACLTLNPTTGFEYLAFVQLGLGAEGVLYRIGY
jgi:hypothetical protein